MKIKTSLASVKILKENDCVPLDKCVCLSNESFSFQLYIQSDFPEEKKISIDSNIPVFCYKVVKKKGNYDINKKTDDYYLHSADDLYPELLVPTDCLKIENGEGTLFFEIPAEKKGPGEHCIEITIGNQKIKIILDVLCEELDQSDLVVTNWMHVDGICNYYHVEPFSDAFYDRFYQFLRAYVKMGNTMLLVPAFTPPLDTAVGKERLTTQLVRIYKERERYRFDFSKMEKYIDTALKFGIEYFEFSHLFTQWGGEYCPKIAVIENGVEKNIFGWAVSSADKSYLDFLRQYLESFAEFAKRKKIFDRSYMHLTDEPHSEHRAVYGELCKFIKNHNGGMKIIDALSDREFVTRGGVDLPAVCIDSKDYPLFKNMDKLLYYCVWVDSDFLTNRYFHMPLLRTEIIGFQLYIEKAKGFLHWGFNFYNTQYSYSSIDPYEDATAGGNFVAGDPFIVYPGKNDVEYSIRYFAMLKAFEDYRLLKTAEKRLGREKIMKMLSEAGFEGLHRYPQNVRVIENLRRNLYAEICD